MNNQVNVLRLTPAGLVNYWWANDLNVAANLVGAWPHVAATFDGTTRLILVDIELTFTTEPGRNYLVESTEDLATGF